MCYPDKQKPLVRKVSSEIFRNHVVVILADLLAVVHANGRANVHVIYTCVCYATSDSDRIGQDRT